MEFQTMFLDNVIEYIHTLHTDASTHVELELKLLLDDRIRKPYFLRKPSDVHNITNVKKAIMEIIDNVSHCGNSTISQTINFIETKTNGEGMFVKQLCYINGVQDKSAKNYYTKKQIIPSIYMVSTEGGCIPYKFSISRETVELSDVHNFDIIRFRLRHSITFTSDLIGWRLDLTFVKETRDTSLSTLKNIRDKLFTKNMSIQELSTDFKWDYPDKIELELEYIGDIKNFDISKIVQLKTALRSYKSDGFSTKKIRMNYNECICEIAHILKPKTLHKFKNGQFGLKQLGSNPVELNKKLYIADVLPNIHNFTVTEKIDGVRSMLIVYPIDKICYIINNKTADGVCIEKLYTYDPDGDNKVVCMIFDAEAIEVTDANCVVRTIYYVFDVIKYQTIDETIYVNTLPFTKRLEYVEALVKQSSKLLIGDSPFLYSKHFIKLSKNTYGTQLEEFYKNVSQLSYEIDGLILISNDNNYTETKNYKWKPKMTIDFVAKVCPDNMLGITPYTVKSGKTLYLLFCGIRSVEYKQLGIERFKDYDRLFANVCVNKYGKTKDSYIPIQFSPSSDPYAYLFWSDNNQLDNKVVELIYDVKLSEWELFKIRHDRTGDMKRKSYYGNYYKFAEYIWMNYKNPLSFDILCQKTHSKQYFKDISTEYVAMRKFNNFVKKQIIELNAKNTDLNWVIELASGKGQDLTKYTDCGFQNILLTDIDYDALTEIINRKYLYIADNTSRFRSKPNTEQNKQTCNNSRKTGYSKIHIKRLDLTNAHKINVSSIYESKFGVPSTGSQFVVCNLALHYIIPNKTKSQNFVNMLNKILAPGGIFIFTAFNGEKVFNLIADHADEHGVWNKYNDDEKLVFSIKKKYTGSTFTGTNQKIDVLLPFTNGEYYTENLINVDVLNNQLAKKKINLIACDSFDIYLKKFQSDKVHFYNKLSTNDKEYSSLYSFYVYHKQPLKKSSRVKQTN
jgi:SAM-dependent methyltransferase